MKFLEYLKIINEEYVGSVKGEFVTDTFIGGQSEVFKNPSLKEMREAATSGQSHWKGFVRFIADFKNQNLYVFKADTLHIDVAKMLKKEENVDLLQTLNETCLWGVAELVRGKLEYRGSDTAQEQAINVIYNNTKQIGDKWTTRWFSKPFFSYPKIMQLLKLSSE